MLKTVSGCILLLFLLANTPAYAQKDSTKRADSVKIDTNLLNKFRLEPRKNAIPLRLRPVQIQQEQIPVTMLDYKVNYWRKWIIVGINVSQSAFSSNWASGGVSSLALGGNFDYKTEYSKTPFDYTGELLMIYGSVANKGQIARKTNDRLFFDNKVATQLSKRWFFFGSLTFESQFAEGFTYIDGGGHALASPLVISKFMSPGYVTESMGIEYKPNKFFDLRLGTGTAKQTIVLDTSLYHHQPANYGVTPGKTFKNELAFQVVSTYDRDIMQNLHLSARYNGFIPYNRGFINIDHRLDATLIAKVNRLLNVNIAGTLLFDHDTSTKLQGTEGFALGIVYKFP